MFTFQCKIKIISFLIFLFVLIPFRANAALEIGKSSSGALSFSKNISSTIPWTNFYGTFSMEGSYVKIYNASSSSKNASNKAIQLNQTKPKPIFIEAESKSASVSTSSPSASYCLRANITFTDNSNQNIYVPFSGGTHSWESVSRIISPAKPVKTLRLIVMVYNTAGTAWFRNVAAFEQGNLSGESGYFDGELVVNAKNGRGYLVKDQSIDSPWYVINNAESGQGWHLSASAEANGNFSTHTATLTNQNNTTRAGTLAYRIPVSRQGLKWCEADLYTQSPVSEGAKEYKNEISGWHQDVLGDYKPKPKHLWGCVVNGSKGYAIAVDPNYPSQFRIHYDSGTQELFILFDLGFAPTVSKATVKFVTWTFNPKWGARQAVKDYYALFPDAYTDRITARGGEHGLWFIKNLSDGSLPNFKDFGLKFNQFQSSDTSWDFDRKNGIHSMKYLAPTEIFLNVAGLPSNPTYSQVIGRLNSSAGQGDRNALSVLNSGVKDVNGNYLYWNGSSWSPNDARFIANPAPGIKSTPNNYINQWSGNTTQYYYNVKGMNGAMVDNVEFFYWHATQRQTRVNFNANQFTAMKTPLVHDSKGNVGIGYEMMIWEYLKAVRTDVKKRNILIPVHGNGVPYNTNFLASQLDTIGGEQSWQTSSGWRPATREALIRFRVHAGDKPVLFLQNPHRFSSWTKAMTKKYFDRCSAYGILPSFFIDGGGGSSAGVKYFDRSTYFERDRDLFKKYIPVIKNLSEAGWEPITNANASDKSIEVERFGSIGGNNKIIYLTVFNPTAATKSFEIKFPSLSDNLVGCVDIINNNSLNWANDTFSLTLSPEAVSVIKLQYGNSSIEAPKRLRIL